ncbi:MAG: hypothetical protein NTY53_19680 [Kiritimatiellaeota bacterium]|nr:hypothetical protein [Kiritimatiellota bacterium]
MTSKVMKMTSRNWGMIYKAKLLVMTLCLIVFTGCGTFATRSRDHSFGAYPYEAVAADFDLFYLGDGSTLNTSCGDLIFISSSIVGDFVLDTAND